jgi:hypothetical protein
MSEGIFNIVFSVTSLLDLIVAQATKCRFFGKKIDTSKLLLFSLKAVSWLKNH